MVVKNINLMMDDNSNIKLMKDEVDETPELHDLRNFVTQLENETGKTLMQHIFGAKAEYYSLVKKTSIIVTF